jgi:hypothetical protein
MHPADQFAAFKVLADDGKPHRRRGPPASLIVRGLPRFSNLGKTGIPTLSAITVAQVSRFARACGLLLEHHRILPKTPCGARMASCASV